MVFGFGRKAEEPAAAPPADLVAETADKAVELKSEGFSVPEPEIGKIYNPYDGLGSAAIDRNALKHLQIRLPDAPEHLFPEESLKKRGWGDNLTFLTGTGYLSGAFLGGAMGAAQALRAKPEHGVTTAKMMRNDLLNKSGQEGRRLGNRLGCIGLIYAGTEGLVDWMLDSQYEDFHLSSVIGGATTGALYQSARGPRAAAVWGGMGAVAVGGLTVISSVTGLRI